MSRIINYISSITSEQIIDVITALCLIVLFRIFSSSIAYIIVRMFKLKVKNKKVIKESAFYTPLRMFFNVLGIYIAILLLKKPFQISNEIMEIVTKTFEICSVIVFAKGLAASFLPKSTLVKKMKEKTTKNVEDSMLSFLLKIVRVVIYIVAGFIVLTLLGINLNGLVAGLGLRRCNSNISSSRYCEKLIWWVSDILRQAFYRRRLDRNVTIWRNCWRYYF